MSDTMKRQNVFGCLTPRSRLVSPGRSCPVLTVCACVVSRRGASEATVVVPRSPPHATEFTQRRTLCFIRRASERERERERERWVETICLCVCVCVCVCV